MTNEGGVTPDESAAPMGAIVAPDERAAPARLR
jgi:hypothetical protein